jgi:two-component system sensor histidine kinase and response regulator WspE
MTADFEDLSQYSMLDLFRLEVETQTALLTQGLLALEANPATARQIEVLMRAAHSLKGAARMVGVGAAVRVAHAMEDCFVVAQKEGRGLLPAQIDILLQGVDLLTQIAGAPEPAALNWEREHRAEIEELCRQIAQAANQDEQHEEAKTSRPAIVPASSGQSALGPPTGDAPRTETPAEAPADEVASQASENLPAPEPVSDTTKPEKQAVRVSPEHLNRLLGLAGEAVVASRWLDTFTADLLRLKRLQSTPARALQSLRETLIGAGLNERLQEQILEAQAAQASYTEALSERVAELELFDRRFSNLAQRLYQEVLDSRLRPFSDGVQGFPRIIRDIARTLGKEVKLEITGEATPVDRDILERAEAPLGHLLRNALDHGIEYPAERERLGKPRSGAIRLEARHHAGMLLITVADDGRGIGLEGVRAAVVRKGLATAEIAAQLNEAELREFLFLPGFTLKEEVTEISGRGVGLDVVQTMVREVGGAITISTTEGGGTTFQLQLPLTLSVIRTLLVEIAGEAYAFPLARIVSALKIAPDAIHSIEGRQHFSFGDQQIGLVAAHQLLELGDAPRPEGELSLVVLGDRANCYGVVVDRLIDERELVVRALDPRLGKIQDVNAAALLPDQSPVLIIDVEDLMRSIENLVSGGRLSQVGRNDNRAEKKRKRVLVVDDSLTVRELERKLIANQGYEVEVAVDGIDGWNAVRTGRYDLVVTDVDMPRMDGIELVMLIKREPRLQSVPVMIVSYKDREEDRRRGLEAGADYYLTKGSFHDETLLQAVEDLIGGNEP